MLCCMLLVSAVVMASLRTSAQEFIFNHLTARDGLASNTVYSLWQDSKGYPLDRYRERLAAL